MPSQGPSGEAAIAGFVDAMLDLVHALQRGQRQDTLQMRPLLMQATSELLKGQVARIAFVRKVCESLLA